MAREIARLLVAELRVEGVSLDAESLRALDTAYRKTAAEAVVRHAHDALLNGLRHDERSERTVVEAFAEALREAVSDESPVATSLPAWGGVFKAVPDIANDLRRMANEA
jgi:hypothetical protein